MSKIKFQKKPLSFYGISTFLQLISRDSSDGFPLRSQSESSNRLEKTGHEISFSEQFRINVYHIPNGKRGKDITISGLSS